MSTMEDAQQQQSVVVTEDQSLKRSSSMKKATKKLVKKLSLKNIKSRLRYETSCYIGMVAPCNHILLPPHSSTGSGVDPADLELLEQIIAENEQKEEKKPTKCV